MPVDFVKPEQSLPSQFIVLYGEPGGGKSTAAATLPGKVLYLNAEGARRLRFARAYHGDERIFEVEFTGKHVLTELAVLLQGPHDFDAFVVDSSGEVYEKLVDEAAGGGVPQIQHYGDAGRVLRRFYKFLRDVVQINCVVVCHEQYQETRQGNTLMPAAGGQKLPQQLCAMADIVGYVHTQALDGVEHRVAQLQPGNGRYAKDSSNKLGAIGLLDLSDWVSKAAKGAAKTSEG